MDFVVEGAPGAVLEVEPFLIGQDLFLNVPYYCKVCELESPVRCYGKT
jgi:hypothetical protein